MFIGHLLISSGERPIAVLFPRLSGVIQPWFSVLLCPWLLLGTWFQWGDPGRFQWQCQWFRYIHLRSGFFQFPEFLYVLPELPLIKPLTYAYCLRSLLYMIIYSHLKACCCCPPDSKLSHTHMASLYSTDGERWVATLPGLTRQHLIQNRTLCWKASWEKHDLPVSDLS